MKYSIVLLFPIAALFGSCGKKQEQAATKPKFTLSDSMQRLITIDTVSYCNISDELSLSGQVSFNENNMVRIFPRSGGLVTETRVSIGDHVTKGQVLATIRSADVAGNYSDLNTAQADVAIAKRQLDNTAELYKSGIASEREYTEARENYDKAVAGKQKVQSLISINGGGRTTSGGDYLVTSPIEGYIVEKKIAAGAFIRPDMSDNLFTVSDLQQVWVYANVYETDIPKVKKGYAVRVISAAYPDKIFEGVIDQVGQVLDPESKAMRVRVILSNKDMLLKPDMFAKVIVSNEEGDKAICVPTAALISQDGRDYVVLFRAKDDIKVVEVDVLKTMGTHTYIKSGVVPGDRLITHYQNLIFSQLMDQ